MSLEFSQDGTSLRYSSIDPGSSTTLDPSDPDPSDPDYTPYVIEERIDLSWWVPTEMSQLVLSWSHPPPQATPDQSDRPADVTRSAHNEPLNEAPEKSILQGTGSTSMLINHRTTTQKATDEGAVVVGSQLLAHLPRLQQGEETYISLLPSAENDKWVRLVWNKAAQNTYSIYDHQTPHLPSVIRRRQGTIEKYSDGSAKRPRLE